ncbi:MAG TPA: enoyl-CoA hydratase [Burkholderiales bacterium]|nr:enoyl-CoA hydratase [Burkholderiales bacterium]
MSAPTLEAARLLVERRGRVLLMTISNPRARNALAPGMYPAAMATLREAATDDGIGAVVLAGEGEHFCGGGNLNRLRAQRELPPEGQVANLNALHEWVMAMRECPKPVIAAVEGAAAGGGFSVCLACDLIVAAEDAKFVMSYVKVGLSPDGGGSDSLVAALPPQAALELLLDGAPVSAARLHALGVVNRVVARGRAGAEALAWAERLARGPARAQARIKELVHAARGRSRQAQLDAERDAFIESLYHDECGEGIAAFLEKRVPKFVS